MLARKCLDLSWPKLASAIKTCLTASKESSLLADVSKFWPGETAVACLSVRTGFDACLQVMALPQGSEILVSAITIPDMIHIIKAHGLVPVPVDIDVDSLTPSVQQMATLVTSQTRAILVAHVFGARMDMDPIASFAMRHGLVIFEDCAQAFAGRTYPGHSNADVRMFSFGPVKNTTALGGALFVVRDPSLRHGMQQTLARYPQQSRLKFFRRVLMYSWFKLVSDSPLLYGAFVAWMGALGRNHDTVIARLGRNFKAGEVLPQIRQRMSTSGLAFLRHRLLNLSLDSAMLRNTTLGQRLNGSLGPAAAPIGRRALAHHYWLYPVRVEDPSAVIARLRRCGLDATSSSNLYVVEAPKAIAQCDTSEAQRMMAGVVYLPLHRKLSRRHFQQLLTAFNEP